MAIVQSKAFEMYYLVMTDICEQYNDYPNIALAKEQTCLGILHHN